MRGGPEARSGRGGGGGPGLRLALLPLLVVAAAAAAGCAPPPAEARVGERAPDFAARDLDGVRHALRDMRGEVVVLNVWATWCYPCRREMPGLEALHRELRSEGLRVVAVSIDAAGGGSAIRDFLAEHDITFDAPHDPGQQVARAFGTRGIPETFLIGRDGTLRHHWIGLIDARSPFVRGPVHAALDEG